MNKFIIALDPSGNYENGKGGTGIAAITEINKVRKIITGTIWAKNYRTKEEYYTAITSKVDTLLSKVQPTQKPLVVIENFKLQAHKAAAQTNQTLETSELIGRLEHHLNLKDVKCVRQQNTVKGRWKRKELITKELQYLEITIKTPDSPHAWDALRHLLTAYFWTFNKVYKKEQK